MPKPWLTAQRSSLTARLDLVVLVAGALAGALGSVVLFGWYIHNPWLVQVRPTFAPMQYNAALSCFLTGIVLVVLRLPARHGLIRLLPALLGLLVGGVGLVGVLGYLTGVPTAYQWQPFTDMAVLSAVGSVILGVGVTAAAWRYYTADASGP